MPNTHQAIMYAIGQASPSSHPKVRWGAVSEWSSLPPFVVHPSSTAVSLASCHLIHTLAEVLRAPETHVGLAECTKPSRVLKAYQLTEHGQPCAAAPASQLPRDTRTVHGRRGNPQHQESWVRHQVSQATQVKEPAYFSSCSVNVLLSEGTKF